MLRVTGPVTSSMSAWRGEATKWMPKRSRSYTGLLRPWISTSQPLQEPASTCRMWSERPSTDLMRVWSCSPKASRESAPGAAAAGPSSRCSWAPLEAR